MIALLRGRIAEISVDSAVIDVGGVGYLVQLSSRTLEQIGGIGEEVRLVIETVVREDSIRLYGFLTGAEKNWFRLLQDVQGVGAKVSLAVLGVLGPEGLAAAIQSSDHAAVARAPGVGPKLAKRVVSELKDKAPAAPIALHVQQNGADRPPTAPGARVDALSALVNLGYSQADASAAIERGLSQLGADAPVGDLIKQGLKILSEA